MYYVLYHLHRLFMQGKGGGGGGGGTYYKVPMYFAKSKIVCALRSV